MYGLKSLDDLRKEPKSFNNIKLFPSMLRHCWLGDRKDIRPVKKLDVGLLMVMI